MLKGRIFLKGIDYFQLLIDHHIKYHGGSGHDARLAVYLQGKVDQQTVLKTIHENSHCRNLARSRISNSFGLGYPSVYFKKANDKVPVSVHQVNGYEIPESYLNIPVDVYHRPPLAVMVFYFDDGNSALLFSFHHILFDFAGVHSLIASISGQSEIPLLPQETNKRPFKTRLNAFFKAVVFTFKEANNKMTVAERSLPALKPLHSHYIECGFTSEETRRIYENCERKNVQLNRSIFFLAAVCKSMHDHIFSKQKKHRFLWVPVPVNVRRKGSANAILFNGLTFLFYKLRPGDLTDFQQTIDSIRNQMKLQMRKDMPNAFIDFSDGYRYMPMPFYYPMLKLPSWGKLSSFSFSVLGDTFRDLNSFMGLPVTEIKNYPSNSVSPGFTFLFYEFRGELRMMTSWVKGQYSAAEQEEVIDGIKYWLLNHN